MNSVYIFTILFQEGYKCSCGNSFSSGTNYQTDLCTIECTGDANQTCGGTQRNNIYLREGNWLLPLVAVAHPCVL